MFLPEIPMKPIRVGLVGSQFISSIHCESLRSVPGAEVVAVTSATVAHAKTFAERQRLAHWFTDFRKMFEMSELDAVVLGLANDLHCEATLAAAAAGKHVICEKPLCLNLDEADRMIEACKKAKVKLMYAEELCFTPKYVRLKQLVDEGALGTVHLVKQAEKHDGPHARWFWDTKRSGGGVTMDMGCHAVEFFRWVLGGSNGGKANVKSVYADMGTYVHGDKTNGDDCSTVIFKMDGGVTAIAEESWAKPGGMDDRAEVYGSEGVAYADLLRGNAIHAYSKRGYGYAVEKAGATQGWTFPIYEEAWNYGFPQEMAHFIECIRDDKKPLCTGEDGKAVLEAIFAAYASAGHGRRVDLPFRTDAIRPIDLWRV
jgi:myo-inositol 2-dehydrogenase/D-chiro-inositol 1-dehydrogenase